MDNFVISLKSVAGLKDQRFFIPSYQRGYRWEPTQVRALLDDLQEFAEASRPAKFYCLQPLVVVRRDQEWEVVDGQQRLTTILLILNQGNPDGGAGFRIRYERHPEYGDGLVGLLRADPADFVSPDLYYLRKAKEEIRRWRDEKHGLPLIPLTSQEDGCAKFIWHVVEDRHAAIDAFTRLNAGKIRLEDAELIRALFLRSGVLDEADRQRIALRWDQMERRLQDPEFWSFVTNEGERTDNRISLLFGLLAKQKHWPAAKERQVFDHLQGLLSDQLARVRVWREMEDLFSTLEEWFEDNRLFHLVGFLVDDGTPLTDIFLTAKPGRKRLVRSLKKQIRARVLPEVASPAAMRKQLEDIRYDGPHHGTIRPLLLCANLAALDADKVGTVRFSFHAYRAEQWDIEHVRATASRPPGSAGELETALRTILNYLERRREDKSALEEIRQALGLPTRDHESLGKLYNRWCEQVDGAEEVRESDGLGNLTLLDAETNRGYGNSPFAVKRAWVLGFDRSAKYLLPCTRNVFTKSDSPAPANLLHWTPDDAKAYLKAIADSLDRFFADTWGEDA